MSLDIWLTGEDETELVSKNITHNLGTMWKEANVYDALYNSDMMFAKEVIPDLADGLERLKKNPSYFKIFSAQNGWGTYEQAVPWLEELIEQFKQYPDGQIGTHA